MKETTNCYWAILHSKLYDRNSLPPSPLIIPHFHLLSPSLSFTIILLPLNSTLTPCHRQLTSFYYLCHLTTTIHIPFHFHSLSLDRSSHTPSHFPFTTGTILCLCITFLQPFTPPLPPIHFPWTPFPPVPKIASSLPPNTKFRYNTKGP